MAASNDMPKHPRLLRLGATYYHRAAVPKDIAETYGKREETFSLKTTDYHEALRLVRIAAVEVDGRFEAHRRKQTRPSQDVLTDDQLQMIYDAYYRNILEEDEETRLSGFEGYTAAKSFDDAVELNNMLSDVTKQQYARGQVDDFFLSEAEDVLSWEDIDITLIDDSPSWRRLARTLQEAHLRASEAIKRRYEGEIVKTPAKQAKPEPELTSSPLLSTLFAERLEEAKRTGRWSPKLIEDYESWTNLFMELQGDPPILSYKKPDARAFKATLLEMPSNRNKRSQTKGLNAQGAVAIAKSHNLPRLSVSTVNKALGRLQATWVWADRQLDEDVPDIFGPMKIEEEVGARDQADPFSATQLQGIFSGPIFTGCLSTRRRTEHGSTNLSDTSWFWLPILGLWADARLNELCQLRVEDVDEENGIPFLRIREGKATQRTKGHKARLVPLHPEVIRLGFKQYVDRQRSSREARVFPDLKLDSKGYDSGKASKDFRHYLERLNLKTKKTSFHSFRHNFKDACRHAGEQPDVNDILQGHALSGMAARYGHGDMPLNGLYAAICKVQFPEVSFENVAGFAYED